MSEKVIFLVDDEHPFRITLCNSLRYFDYVVHDASCGKEFTGIVKKYINSGKVPDALIVDNQMPYIAGNPESQWCGLESMIALCEDFPKHNLGHRVIFLSRWELIDLPSNYEKRREADTHDLLNADRWVQINTPFFVLRSKIEELGVSK